MDISLVHSVVAMFQQHQPWMADKLGGALVTQGLKELWEQVKAKLNHSATDKIEEKPDDAGQGELFRSKLLVALDEDPLFQSKIRELAEQSEREMGISLNARGTGNKQIAVNKSTDVKISVK